MTLFFKFKSSEKFFCNFLPKQDDDMCHILFSLTLHMNNKEDDNQIVTFKVNAPTPRGQQDVVDIRKYAQRFHF